MLSLLHIFSNVNIADVASFFRMGIFSVESPSKEMIDLRYLNDVSSSRLSPVINIVVIGAILLLNMILLFSALISIP